MSVVISTETDGAVRTIRLTGVPRRGNPLSNALMGDLLAAVRNAEEDGAIRCLAILGTPTHFSVGADIEEMLDKRAIDWAETRWMDDWDTLRAARKPIIAGVRGHAVGGGLELALLCDLIVCAEDARLALPETALGVIPGTGGGQRLIALCGRAIAADMILTGRVLSGREARDLGIAARAVPAEQVEGEVVAIGKAIAERSPTAIAFAREVLRHASEGPIAQSLRIERLLAYLVFDSDDRRRRMTDFLAEKGKSKKGSERG
ncbi:MAG: enoyl-CoA hydratase/isomerase family protein [Rhodospirillales bacterium]|nr:enoyl-CoA hydratase/isomerase family protein [Rhodospirillales bacterium]